MKNATIILLALAIMSTACKKSEGGSDSGSKTTTTSTPVDVEQEPVTPDEVPEPDPVIDPIVDIDDDVEDRPVVIRPDVPELALSFDTNIGLMNFTAAQAEKYNKAIEITKLVVGTEEFRKRVLNHTYGGVKTYVQNNGLTNAQIYQAILDAAEKLRPIKNNAMDLEVELYYANNSVVGYTYPSSTQIWVNTKFFNSYQASSVAGNLFHEWLHKIGYGHDSSATARRPYSVPYAIGYMMSSLGKNFL